MDSDGQYQEKLTEAARYALFRRLLPMLRHNLAGALQPLGMMSMLLEKRLQNPSPDLAAVAKSASQLTKLSREASSECMGMMIWFAPGAPTYVKLAAGVEDATGLVATELSFRGFSLINKVEDLQVQLPTSLLRSVFMAALLCLTDAATGPVKVLVEAKLVEGQLVLTLSTESTPSEVLGMGQPAYRKIDWVDVQAIARADCVDVRQAENSMQLTFGAALITVATV